MGTRGRRSKLLTMTDEGKRNFQPDLYYYWDAPLEEIYYWRDAFPDVDCMWKSVSILPTKKKIIWARPYVTIIKLSTVELHFTPSGLHIINITNQIRNKHHGNSKGKESDTQTLQGLSTYSCNRPYLGSNRFSQLKVGISYGDKSSKNQLKSRDNLAETITSLLMCS